MSGDRRNGRQSQVRLSVPGSPHFHTGTKGSSQSGTGANSLASSVAVEGQGIEAFIPQQQPRYVKNNSKRHDPYILEEEDVSSNRSDNTLNRSENTLSGSDLEDPNKLHNERRLFTFLLSRKVPPILAPEEREYYPWKTSSYFKRALFSWLIPILVKGYKRTLQPNDMYLLTEELKVENMHKTFDEHLRTQIIKSKEKHLKKNTDLSNYKWPTYLIPYCLFLTFKWEYSFSTISLALSFCCQALSPLLTRRLIDFVENRYLGIELTYNRGIGYTIGSVILIFVNGLLLNHFFHKAMICGAQVKAVLTKSILLKSFDLSAKSRHQYSIGRITSLMSTDLARIDLAVGFQPLVLCFPIPVIIAIVLLLINIGVSSLAGIGLFVVSVIICVLSTRKLFLTREIVVKYTDERIGLMRDVLSNLKIIKFYAWELAYKLQIIKVREKELKHLFTIKVLRNFITAYAVTLPQLTSMISFVTSWETGNRKSAGEVFSSLSLFSILAQAIMLLPIALATGADALIGFDRCRDFLSAEEFNDDLDGKLNKTQDFYLGDQESKFDFKNNATLMSYEPKDNGLAIEAEHADFVWENFHDELANNSLWEDEALGLSSKNESKSKKKSRVSHKEKETFDSSRSSNDTYYEEPYSLTSQNQFPGLVDINLTIEKNEFVIITGSIGSGKSSLLNALAGFMKLTNPEVGNLKIHGDSLLCSTPWIQNATVKENIIFGKPFDKDRYKAILRCCALEDDIALLSHKDNTEIGERGVTLSGGQKARINLARAVYSDADILMFDDVLSAVDSRVGKHIVDNLFNDFLVNKTRVLATHQLSLTRNADKVVFLNGNGSIDVGTVGELRTRNDHFKRLIEFNEDVQDGTEEQYRKRHGIVEENSDRIYENGYDNALKKQTSSNPENDDLMGRIVNDEERATNSVSWAIYKKYIQLGSGIFGVAAAPIFLLVISIATFCQVFTNTWLSFWMERKFIDRDDNFYIALYVMFAILTVVFTAAQFTMLAYMNNKSANKLNIRALSRILHAPMSFMDVNPMGRILNRFTKDTDSLDNELGEQLRLFLFPLATIIGIIILCITYLPWFAVAVPFLGFGFIFLANFYNGSSREIKRLESTQRSLVYNNFNETLTGMSTIKAYKADNDFIKKNDRYINQMNEAYYLSIATQRWLCIHLDILASIFALIICLLCITEQFNISAESTGLLLSYVIQIVGLLALSVRSMTQVENEMNSVERVYQYGYHLPQEAAYEKEDYRPSEEWPPSGYIQFDKVSLRYRPELPLVLKDFDLNIYPGEKVGICGRTGAGKSSIMTALYRLSEIERGSVNIDGLNVKDLGLRDLRSKLSIIPQDPVLFRGSIRKNLDPFSEYDDEVLWDALRRSGLLEWQTIARIKNIRYSPVNKVGYEDLHKFHLDQLVEDEGNNFSLGERQLLALARALVRNSKILILDEATSSVDYETDSRIQSTISKEFSRCTILCIAHRLKTILHYDRIIVMDEGQIIEKGTPRKLFTQNGAFRKMCDKANIVADDF